MPGPESGHVESLFFFGQQLLQNETKLGLSPHALLDAMALI